MAITCTGPPPLPPGKRFLQRASRKLAVGPTYRSFRDPSLEAWIPPSQRVGTPRNDDDDDVDDIDGFDLSGIKILDEAPAAARLDTLLRLLSSVEKGLTRCIMLCRVVFSCFFLPITIESLYIFDQNRFFIYSRVKETSKNTL